MSLKEKIIKHTHTHTYIYTYTCIYTYMYHKYIPTPICIHKYVSINNIIITALKITAVLYIIFNFLVRTFFKHTKVERVTYSAHICLSLSLKNYQHFLNFVLSLPDTFFLRKLECFTEMPDSMSFHP